MRNPRSQKNINTDSGGVRKRSFLLAVLVLLVYFLYATGLKWGDFIPTENGFKILKKFITAAFHPALDYQSTNLPSNTPPYYTKVLGSLWLTLQYATCAISIALVIGITFAFFSAKSWWPETGSSRWMHILLVTLHRISRTVITLGRSIHELIWALLFITALGTSPFAAIMAIAIPYGCTLAKVISEIIDETNRRSSKALRAHGANSASTWIFGILPLAMPDIVSYALYRYECAIRSAAILGFVGITTIGYHIETAFSDGNYNEIWTLLYSLLILLIAIEFLSGYIRKKINNPPTQKKISVSTTPSIAQLKRQAGKKYPLWIITAFFAVLTLVAWNTGEPMFSSLSPEQRSINLSRFLEDITPYPVQESADWSDAIPWAKELLMEKGFPAALQTFYIASAAISIAFLLGVISIPFSSKILNESRPWGTSFGATEPINRLRKIVSFCFKSVFMITRSMPEYLLAYLLLMMLGPTAWPLILGLALHNYGIIGRLGGETIDNADPSRAKVLLSLGASRNQTYVFAILPNIFNRLVLYFFYRWETCIREATVMGMLGISSLGFIIDDARFRGNRDEMLLYILLGAFIVMIGDIVSDIVRSRLRSV